MNTDQGGRRTLTAAESGIGVASHASATLPHKMPRVPATVITEALRTLSVRTLGPGRDDDASWLLLEDQLGLLAEDLAIAIDDRPTVCRDCGAPCNAPPLATLAALLRPAEPRIPLVTDSARARRLGLVMAWVVSSLLGQCHRHGLPAALLHDGPAKA